MLYKVVKPSRKNAEERESLKKSPRFVNSDKKSGTKSSDKPPAALGAFNYCEKSPGDHRDKLKPLASTPGNSGQETFSEVQQLVRHVKSTAGEKNFPPRNENPQANGSCSVQNADKCKNKSFERLTRSNGPFINKNSTERTKTQKLDPSKKLLGMKSKSYISEFPERKAERKIVDATPEKNRNGDLLMKASDEKKESPERKRIVGGSKKEVSKSQSAVGPVHKRKRSEIPLLKTRQIPEKKTEVVSLLMQKTLKENDSATSVDLYQDGVSVDEFSAASELKITFRADENSSRPDENGEEYNLRSSARKASETAEDPFTFLKSSNVPFDSNISDHAVEEKKTFRASRAKTLDLEKVKTSSFTVLRAEGDSFNRLESFHQQNITAKETARAEIAKKASKILLMTSKASFSSLNSKKNVSASGGDKGTRSNSKKTKAIRHESQNINFQKNCGPKVSEMPHLDLSKETKGTIKAGCFIPKRIAEEKKNKNASPEEKSQSSQNAAEPGEKTERKIITKEHVKEKESSKKNKTHHSSEEALDIQSLSGTVENKEVPKCTSESSTESSETTGAFAIESPIKDVSAVQGNKSEEIPDEEVKLTPRELASLVVTGTALNFDDIEIFERPPEVNKIKLEIKIDVPSEEEVTDSDAVECESSGNVSGTSFDWLLMSKMQNREKQTCEPLRREDKKSKEKLSSWHFLSEELKTGECQPDETVLPGAHRSLSSVKRRPHFTKTLININGMEKKSGFESDDRWSFPGNPYNCSMFLQNNRKRDTVSFTKVRSGLTKSSNREEKIFDDPTSLKLRRRNSEPYSLRGFIWKRADVTSPKSLKPSVSSVASSLRHLNTDDMDDFIFWEAVPQKLTSCWEMSLYHFKRPWSVLSFSVFKDNRRSNTPGLILDTLRSGGVTNIRAPLLYQNDRINSCKGNIFDVEPSISQKNIDIRNWLAALNFTTPLSNATDVVSENILSVPPVLDTQKQANPRRRNVMPQFRPPDKVPERKLFNKVKNRRFDKWSISEVEDLKELIRKESGSYVTKEQYILSEISCFRPTAVANTCTLATSSEKEILKETDNQNSGKEVKSVETSCQSEPSEAQEQLKLKETPDSSSASLKSETVNLPPEVNIWKYLFLFTLMFIIFHYSLGSNFVMRP